MSHTCPIGRAAWIKLTYTERSRDENQHLPGISRHREQKEMVPEAKEKKKKESRLTFIRGAMEQKKENLKMNRGACSPSWTLPE